MSAAVALAVAVAVAVDKDDVGPVVGRPVAPVVVGSLQIHYLVQGLYLNQVLVTRRIL